MNSKHSLQAETLRKIFQNKVPGTEEGYKFFSVLVPVVEKADGLYLLYEVRAKHMVRQPGEVCFPGGEMEGDETREACALRETWEEIGVPAEEIEIINQLDTIYTYSNFTMYCYLGLLKEDALSRMKLNPDEVDEVFLLSVDELLAQEPEIYRTKLVPEIPEDFPHERVTGTKHYAWRTGNAIVPVYELNGRIVWGLTARITRRLMAHIRADEMKCAMDEERKGQNV